MNLRRDVFQAIADPTRRAILLLVASQSMTAGAIAANFDTAWKQFVVPFASLTQQGYGTPTVFTPNAVTDVRWQVNGPTSFDFAVDDITFF